MPSRPTGPMRRLVAALGATACVLANSSCSSDGSSAEGATPTGSAAASSDASAGTYLALGDSVPFGFRGGATSEFSDAANFVGYPELVADELGLEVVNASCPGETAASFLDVTAQSNGCVNSVQSGFGYRTAYPLHVRYDSRDQSQMDLAVRTLTETEDIDLVTLQIGANDAFVCQQTTASRCSDMADLQAMAQTLQGNLDRILATLRGEAGYDGQIVVVTYYALNYAGPTAAATQLLDNAIAQVAAAHQADVADAYAAFKPRADATAGDSVAAGLVLPDDVHPSADGQQLLADAVTAVVQD
jgi:lysophospholipase L1-like esterase